MGKQLAKPVIQQLGKVITEVTKDAGLAALQSTLQRVSKSSSPMHIAKSSPIFMQDVHGKAADAANKALKEIPHNLPKAQAKAVINETATAAATATFVAMEEKADIAAKEETEETAAAAAADATAKHAFQVLIMKEHVGANENRKADRKPTDIDGVRYNQKKKDNENHHEIVDLMKNFSGTTETFKEDILFNLKEGKTNPIFDVCTNGLLKIETQMKQLQTWIHGNQHTSTQPESDALPGEMQRLAPFVEPLIAGMGNLQRLAKTRQQKQTREFTDAQLNSLKQCIDKVNTSFEILTGYMIGMRSVSGDDLDTIPKDISEKGDLHLATFL